jgi:hypothetical protein
MAAPSRRTLRHSQSSVNVTIQPRRWTGACADPAAHVVRVLAGCDLKRTAAKSRARPRFEEKFVEEHVPEWSDLIARALERG